MSIAEEILQIAYELPADRQQETVAQMRLDATN
jgi:hypothetical protein